MTLPDEGEEDLEEEDLEELDAEEGRTDSDGREGQENAASTVTPSGKPLMLRRYCCWRCDGYCCCCRRFG